MFLYSKEKKITTTSIRLPKTEPVYCYDLKLKGLSNKTTLVLSNTRELDRDPFTK